MKPETNRPQESGPSRNGPTIPIVGIGASAGGIGALETLVPLLERGAGLAYVVVQHLDPERKSGLTGLLGRTAKIPVIEIADQVTIEADHVYVIPPNAALAISDKRLQISPPIEQRFQRTPIDGFFISLAEANGECSAGVILSGTGSDGTIGLRAIKEHGGLTVAQDDAEYDGMMRSAVRSGMVDFVLPLEKIPARLNDYFRHLTNVEARKGPDGVRPEAADHLAQIAALLRTRTGHDFSGYKDKTVARRVQRRMQVLQIDEVPDFIERLRKEPQELDALLQDLLIGVTNFFRDPPAFEALEREVIPQLFAGKGPDDTVRVWVPGCSTGEEAYSIAILLREHMPKQRAPKLQIFASDIDEQSLQIARTGRFPSTIAKDIPPARLERYFVREDGTYRIASDLREICLFSSHNLLRDAPFSKLDLITCRNLLIYLTPELQNRLIPLFHYALNDDGFLFLGTSENVTRHPRLFSTVDKQHRIFKRKPLLERRLPEFPLTAPEGGRRQLGHDGARTRPSANRCRAWPNASFSSATARPMSWSMPRASCCTARAAPGSIWSWRPARRARTSTAWRVPGCGPTCGRPCTRRPSTGQIAIHKDVAVGTNGGRQTIDLIVHPIRSAAIRNSVYMVVFQDVGGIRADVGRGDRWKRRRAGERQPAAARDGAARDPRAAADDDRGARILQRGAEVGQRGALLDERGAAVGQRGARDLEGGAAVDQRGTADRQCRAQCPGRGAEPRQLRHRQPAGKHADRHGVPRPQPCGQELHAGGQGPVPPGRKRHRPADHPCPGALPVGHRAGGRRARAAYAVDHRAPDRGQRQRRALHHAHDALPLDRQRDQRRGHHVPRHHPDHRGGDAHRRADGGPAQPPAEPGDAAQSAADRNPDRRGRPRRPGSRQPPWRAVAGRERRGRRRRGTSSDKDAAAHLPGRPGASGGRSSRCIARRIPARPCRPSRARSSVPTAAVSTS